MKKLKGTRGNVTLSATVTRTSGIAPLAVWVDCTATTSTATSEPLHDIRYTHVVTGGDLGNWTYGLRAGSSRNTAYGPVASFVFKAAGTWTITTTPYINGLAGTPTANVITVTAADSASEFSGTKTIYASPNGVYPPEVAANGWSTTTESNFRLLVAMLTQTTKKRLILDGTQSFTVTDAGTSLGASLTGLAALGPIWIGGHTNGTPTIATTGTWQAGSASSAGGKIFGISSSTTPHACVASGYPGDIRVTNLKFDASASNVTYGIDGITVRGGVNQVTISDCEFVDCHQAITSVELGTLDTFNGTGSTDSHVVYNQIAIHDCYFHTAGWDGVPSSPSGLAYGIFWGGKYFSEQGCSVDIAGTATSNSASHVNRLYFLNRGVVANNELKNPGPTELCLKIYGPTIGTSETSGVGSDGSYYQVFADNIIDAGVGSQGPINLPANSGKYLGGQIIFERNWIKFGDRAQVGAEIEWSNVTVRNNIISVPANADGAVGFSCNRTDHANAQNTEVINAHRYYNNTMFSLRTSGTQMLSAVAAAGQGTNNQTDIIFRNNFCYAPSDGAAVVLYDTSSRVTAGNNSSDAQARSTSPYPFVTNPPAVFNDFQLVSGCYAKNAGANVPVWQDAWFTTRVNGSMDIGAFEQ